MPTAPTQPRRPPCPRPCQLPGWCTPPPPGPIRNAAWEAREGEASSGLHIVGGFLRFSCVGAAGGSLLLMARPAEARRGRARRWGARLPSSLAQRV